MRRSASILFAMGLLACGTSEPQAPTPDPAPNAPVLPSPDLPPTPGERVAVRLDTPGPLAFSILDALRPTTRIELPPRRIDSAGPISLENWQEGAEPHTWTHESPTRFDHGQYRDTPPGTELLDATGAAIPFAPSLAGRGSCGSHAQCWEVQKGSIHYKGPSPSGLTLHHAPTAADESRRTPAEAGLALHEFVQWSAQIDTLTREALLVPAGGRVTQTVPVDTRTTLRFGFGAPAARLARAVDTPSARILINDTPVWTGSTQTGAPWTEHTVDLSSYAGQTVALTFQTHPGTPEASGRSVAFAEPELAPSPDPKQTPRRVVIIGIDTIRLDHLGLHGASEDQTPGLDAWGQSAIVFDNARAPAPRTRPSFRSALTGRWPVQAIGAAPLFRHFADAGFTTAGIVANVHLQPHLGFAEGAGWWDYHDSDDAGPQVDRAIEWLDRHHSEDSFLFLHIMDPHIFYMAPEPFTDAFTGGMKRARLPDRYNRWTIREAMEQGRIKPVHKRFIQARYRGEVRYLDHELSRLLAHIDQLPGDTLVVLHSDHGEELWDHGDFEHNHTLYDELMRTMLWIRPPGGWSGGPTRIAAPVSLVDIAPTLHALVGLDVDADPPLDGTSLAAFLDPSDQAAQTALSQSLYARPLPMGHMMFAREQWGVVFDDWTYTIETITGAETAYALATDPGQQSNRLADAPLDMLRAALSQATGFPVGPGWRLKVEHLKVPFTLHFDVPVEAAGVIDPEAGATRRANIEWGEVPPVLPDDVATIELLEEGRTIRVTPGSVGSGTLYILGPSPTDVASVHTAGMPDYTIQTGSRMLGRGTAQIAAGTLVVPGHGEAEALAESGDPRLYEALRAMGYVE